MRILLLPHRFGPEARGGVETWAARLAAGLVELGHEVTILTRDDRPASGLAPFPLVAGPEVEVPVWRIRHRHEHARSFRDSWADPRFRAPIEAVLDAVPPDVVHVGHPDGWGVWPFRLAAARGLVTGATLHDYKWICARGQMIRPDGDVCEQVVEGRCLACVTDRGPLRGVRARLLATPWRRRQRALLRELEEGDLLTSPSRFVAARIAAAGLERPIAVISNPTPTPQVRPASSEPAGPVRIGFFGNPHPSKGLRLLTAAFASLPPGSARLELHGPAPTDLGAAPEGAVAHGPYPEREAVDRMRSVDLVAIPSTWDENQPMVALEARAAGRPLLVSDRGGLPELVHDGVDGWVVPSGDREAWGLRLALLCADRSTLAAAAAAVRPPPAPLEVARAFTRGWLTGTAAARVDSDALASGE